MGRKQYQGRPGRPKKRRFHGKKNLQEPESVADTSAEVLDPTPDRCHADSPHDESDVSESVLAGNSEDDSSGDLTLSGEDSDVSSSDEESFASLDECESDGSATRTSGFRLIDLECLQTLLCECVSCKDCHGPVRLEEVKRDGLATTLQIVCDNCKRSSSEAMSKKYGRMWEVNRRFVYGMRWLGKGYQAMRKLCAALNMPHPMSLSAFHGHSKALAASAHSVAERSMASAAKAIPRQDCDERTGNELCDIAVTYDGTWMRRGYASLYGVFVAISWETGKVLDYQVLSRFCQLCNSFQLQLDRNKIIIEEHAAKVAAHECMANTTSSAPAMEMEAAVLVWSRSIERRQLRYTIFIGDGDTKSYKAVCDAKPYDSTEIIKEECVGHVQKRVGSNLRKLKKDMAGKKLEDGRRVSGRGRLTDKAIDKLQAYYGMAIRSHPNDLQGMAKAIWASLMHRASTDEEPQHQFCPPGANSWCKWQCQQAGGPQYSHHDSIPKAIFNIIKPIYIRLADKALLERCLRGATQNRNEAFNGMLWQLCPKTGFCSSRVVATAVALTTAWYNDGPQAIEHLLSEMSIPVGEFTSLALSKFEEERKKESARKRSEETKKKRKKRRRLRKGVQEAEIEEEGVTYEAGAF